ncbi:MAG: dolichyl-diphosphooligosaccharide--protein glycosyltransferase subunit STT3 [Saccharofermentans sp.]|nr:dolichyl-diphosphooligosaccharide--protein glycosyltransferase subunit STT3 [Saccharofermentans sp.]
MKSAAILAIIFAVISLGLLVYFCFLNVEDKKLKKFYIAATSVYVSGTILITVLSATVSKLTVGNVIALETVILFVYVFDTYMLKRIAKNIADYEKAVIENRDKKDDVEKE